MTNLKLVLKVYTAYRQMSPDDIALLETLRGLNDSDRELMVETLQGKPTTKTTVTGKRKIERCEACNYTRRAIHHNNPEHADYHEFVLAEKAGKKSSTSQSSSKSPRASGMAAQLNKSLKQQQETATNHDEYCVAMVDDNGGEIACGATADANVHHLTTHPDYHPFQPATTAPPAPAPSPANGASSATERDTRRSAPPSTPESGDGESGNASLSTVGSGTQGDSAGSVAHGASGGD